MTSNASENAGSITRRVMKPEDVQKAQADALERIADALENISQAQEAIMGSQDGIVHMRTADIWKSD